jgi:cytochrome c peroxidase
MSRAFPMQWLPKTEERGTTRMFGHWRRSAAAVVLILSSLQLSPTWPPSRAAESSGPAADEPITPTPNPPPIDSLKVRLGERLFGDRRLSRDNSHSCSSCHDLATNGASANRRDVTLDGAEFSLNTPTIFNATLNFRFGWEGKIRTLEADTLASLESPRTMAGKMPDIAAKLDADPDLRNRFTAAYGSAANAGNIVDAIASFERTLVTPGSRFDRWLEGDAGALSKQELDGYHLFKSLGCVSCHQGVNVGGNLFQRHGIFHPLAAPDPEILRVPSLRNVATTPPYFHDGSAPTLDEAVRKMGRAQLNATLTDPEVNAIVAFLQTLTGKYRGAPVGASP